MRVSNSIGKCLFGCTLALTWSVHGQTGSEPSFDLKVIDQQTVEMSWTNLSPGFIYQESESPSASARWKGVLQNPALNGNKASLTRSLSGDWTRWFFRLRSKGASSGLDYLNATQSPDGTWGIPSGTLARDTATALDALALYGQNNAFYSQGLAGLLGLSGLNNDFKARRAMTLAVAGFDTTTFLTDLLDSQNTEVNDAVSLAFPGRGWGLSKGFGNSTLDSALVLRALKAGGALRGLAIVKEAVVASGSSPAHAFNIPVGAASHYLKVRTVTGGTLRFKMTPPGSSSFYYVDIAPRTTTVSIAFPSDAGDWVFAVQNMSATAASYTTEVGFTTSDGFDVFRITTPLVYLGLAQNADGGWGIGSGEDSQLMVTAEVLRSLAATQGFFVGPQAITAGVAWLRSHQNPDGGFSSVPGASNPGETSLAMLAINAVDLNAALASASAYLKGAQLANGSWGDNPHQTAIVVQALHLPPVLIPIPGQTVSSPAPFASINLDDYVSDPDHADAEIAWSVTGNTQLTVAIVGRVATITYAPGTPLSEQLTFRATDPDGFSATSTATFSVSFTPNQPPMVSAIPGQTVTTPDPFVSINLDNYVADPDNADTQINWTFTGNNVFTVNIVNRVATITYPPGITSSVTELLTFRATDPGGLFASTTASFSVVYAPVDYVIPRGGSITDSRLITMSEQTWIDFWYIGWTISGKPAYLSYANAFDFPPPNGLLVEFTIGAAADATVGTTQFQVDYGVQDANHVPLGPLTNNIFNFRIQVTP